MDRRTFVVVALAVGLVSGCGAEAAEEEGRSGDSERGARGAVETYVRALNARDADALMKVGGVPDDARARREARRIIADKGGRELSIVDVRVEIDMGPDVGSARLRAREGAGKGAGNEVRDVFTVVRREGEWYVVVFIDRPSPPGKTASKVREGG
ncbi:hypothetical protein ACFWZT_03790 [Streptomyces alboflavus]|uniref:hypothetical protein n=1 Tax=Streptomyces alboflavus TaxID=67267 RepID=UPI0036A8D13F